MFYSRPVQYLGLILLVAASLAIIFVPTGSAPKPTNYTITLVSPKPFLSATGAGKDPVKAADDALVAEFNGPNDKLPTGALTIVPGPNNSGTADSTRATIEDQASTLVEARNRLNRIVAALNKPFPGVAPAPETFAALAVLPPKPLFVASDFAVFPPKKHNGGLFPSVKLGLDLQGGVNLVLQVRQALFTYHFEQQLSNDQDARDQFAAQIQTIIQRAPDSLDLKDSNINLVPGENNTLEVHTQASTKTEFDAQRKAILGLLTSGMPDAKFAEARTPQFFVPDSSVAKQFSNGSSTMSDQLLDRTVEIIRSRVDKLGVSEPLIQKQPPNRIIVQLPGVNDPQKAVEVIGKTAQMQILLLPEQYQPVPDNKETSNTLFIDTQTKQLVPNADIIKACLDQYPDHKPIVTGVDVQPTSNAFPNENGQPAVHFDLQGDGKQRFAEATAKNVHRYMPIFLDERCISSPTINEPIENGSGEITGGTMDDARSLALLLNSGALPAPIDVVENRTVSATLGTDSLIKSVKAGAIGIFAVAIFMVVFYRLPGMLANCALVIYCILNLAVFILFGGTLTLPGIAGFLLAIAMSLDTNILVFERLKEELAIQPTFAAALRAAFSRAWTAILDSHVTTLLAALVLFWLGSGPVKGFALTLGIGVLLSLFSAISVTKLFMWSVAHYGETHRKAFAGHLPDPGALAISRR